MTRTEADDGAEDAAPDFDERPPKKTDAMRTDIVSRETRPVSELIRFVLAPDGSVVPDLKRNLPGRGVWVEATRVAVETAVKRRLFGRSLRQTVEVAADLAEMVDGLMAKQALGTFGLARKAGLVITGFAKVEQAVARERLAGLVHAAEAGSDGVEKLAAALKRRFGEEIGCPVVRIFAGAQLDLALGRSNVIHAALLAGRASDTFLERAGALGRYRGISPAVSSIDEPHATSGLEPQD